MPGTLEALLIAVLVIVPGALYTWTFEQQAGRWGATATDRLQRFLGVSAVFLVLELPLLYELYRRFLASGALQRGDALPPWIWLLCVGLVALPVLLGRGAGLAARQRRPWVRLLTGPAPAPRAWDHLFSAPDRNGVLVLRLLDGTWLAGVWGTAENGLQSYAAGYPEAQDLFLPDTVPTDAEGRLEASADGRAVLTGVAVLLRWDQIAYARFIPS